MKNLIITILCSLIFIQLDAQQHNQIVPRTEKKGSGEWLEYKATEQTSVADLVQNKNALRLGMNDGLISVKTIESKTGYRHHRYQQTYKGVQIDGAIFTLHEKNNQVERANGGFIRGLNISTTPTISQAEALLSALQYTDAVEYAWESAIHENLIKEIERNPNATLYPEGELILVDTGRKQQADDYRLAYKFDIFSIEPESRQYVYVDAQTCEVVMAENRIYNCMDVDASGTTNYSGTINFTACHDTDEGHHILKNNTGAGGMQVFDGENGSGNPLIPFTDTDSFFDNDPTANEVHWAVENTRNYFDTVHGRESFDDNGMPICSWIRHRRTPTETNNAYWNGMFLQFGDGDGVIFSSLTAPDVVAHEFTHGITDFSAGLKYYNEHGALNESFSDIFGEVLERQMRGTNDWIIGADFVISPNFGGLRNASNPKDSNMINTQPDTYLGTNWHTGFTDGGGVHTNSGVQNYWFYLLSEGGSGVNDNGESYNITGIGMEKAAAIAYLNLTAYLSPTSEYSDAREGAMQAATVLYGADSDEVNQTEAAWDAVGVYGYISGGADCRMSDSLALVALYNSADGINGDIAWDLYQPIDTWVGVSLNENGCVAELTIDSHNNSSICIPPEIGNLINLRKLDLFYIGCSGNIPPEIGNLINLRELSLHNNVLMTGNIPPEIGNLINLRKLDLSGCSGNIPPEIGNLINLRELYLHGNRLTGSIPSTLGNLINLRKLDLSYIGCSGNIPPEIGNLINLRELSLYNNELMTGSIPPEIGNLINLRELSLYNNELMTGSIPGTLGNLVNLQFLALASNNLFGNIPPEVGNLTNLVELHLNGNELTGSIPSTLGNLINLNTLFMGNNQLTGNLPYALGNLVNLRHLNLPNNQLTGNIPNVIGGLVNLESINLGVNQLTGSIPPEFGNLRGLWLLALSDNNLSGCYDTNLLNLNNYTFWGVSLIDTGNNFDAKWDDFMSNGDGACEPFEYPNCRMDDSLALVDFYNAVSGLDWDLNQPLTEWYGIALNGLGCVTSIILYDEDISGVLTNSIGDLNSLVELYLAYNEFTGTLPSEIGNLSNLRILNLVGNQFTGSLPSEIGNLTNLRQLDLTLNEFTGNIPATMGNLTNLWYLTLRYNQFTGSIPATFRNLSSLQHLSLYGNNLGGCHDAELTELCGQTSQLYYYLTSVGETIYIDYEHNLIDYGNNFIATWEDFCNTGAGVCAYTSVWPGDFNRDGTANTTDLLYWGLEVGSTGVARPQPAIDWSAQEAYDWSAVHQDGNGDGTVDFDDIAVLEQNYGLTHLNIPPYEPNQGLVSYELELYDIDQAADKLYYNLYLVSKTGAAASMHGLNGKIDFSQLDMPYAHLPQMDTTGSALEPSAFITHYDYLEKVMYFALTRTDKNNELLDTLPIANFIVVVDDLEGGGDDEYLVSAGSGSFITANGALVAIGETSHAFAISPGGLFGSIIGFVTTSDEQCNLLGNAKTDAIGGVPPYSYQWSNGATTQEINLEAGNYRVTISDAVGGSQVLTAQINPPTPIYNGNGNEIDCNGVPVSYATLDICALLEGAYDTQMQQMSTKLNIERHLLPGQTPANPLVAPTPSGQPYNQPPWNYTGVEGRGWSDVNYSSDMVDWVLVSFRTGIPKATEIARTAAIVQKDGCVYFPNRNVLPTDAIDSVYVVIEHRNHMGIMTAQPIPIVDGTLTYDFRLSDTYTNNTGYGQKQLSDDNWAMFAGDCSQEGDIQSYDINGTDKILWQTDNGSFDIYTPSDLDFDGDASGNDKVFWFDNNGISSRVPK